MDGSIHFNARKPKDVRRNGTRTANWGSQFSIWDLCTPRADPVQSEQTRFRSDSIRFRPDCDQISRLGPIGPALLQWLKTRIHLRTFYPDHDAINVWNNRVTNVRSRNGRSTHGPEDPRMRPCARQTDFDSDYRHFTSCSFSSVIGIFPTEFWNYSTRSVDNQEPGNFQLSACSPKTEQFAYSPLSARTNT